MPGKREFGSGKKIAGLKKKNVMTQNQGSLLSLPSSFKASCVPSLLECIPTLIPTHPHNKIGLFGENVHEQELSA